MDISVLDLGSNSFQLLFARCSRFARVERLFKSVEFVDLAAHVSERGEITAQGFNAALSAVATLLERAPAAARKKPLIAFATHAIREASNGSALLTALEARTGVHARIVTGSEAARLAYIGAASEFELRAERLAVVDLGGGSTELAWGVGKHVGHCSSVRLGVTSLIHRLTEMPNTANVALDHLAVFVRRSLEPAILAAREPPPDVLVFASGVARVVQSVIVGSGLAPAGAPIDGRVMREAIPRLLVTPLSELRQLGVPEQRLKTVGPTAIVLEVVRDLFEKDEFIVAQGGLREGAALQGKALGPQPWPNRAN